MKISLTGTGFHNSQCPAAIILRDNRWWLNFQMIQKATQRTSTHKQSYVMMVQYRFSVSRFACPFSQKPLPAGRFKSRRDLYRTRVRCCRMDRVLDALTTNHRIKAAYQQSHFQIG